MNHVKGNTTLYSNPLSIFIPPSPFFSLSPHTRSVTGLMTSNGTRSSATTWSLWNLSPIRSFRTRIQRRSMKDPRTDSCKKNWIIPRISNSRCDAASFVSCRCDTKEAQSSDSQSNFFSSQNIRFSVSESPFLPWSLQYVLSLISHFTQSLLSFSNPHFFPYSNLSPCCGFWVRR